MQIFQLDRSLELLLLQQKSIRLSCVCLNMRVLVQRWVVKLIIVENGLILVHEIGTSLPCLSPWKYNFACPNHYGSVRTPSERTIDFYSKCYTIRRQIAESVRALGIH